MMRHRWMKWFRLIVGTVAILLVQIGYDDEEY